MAIPINCDLGEITGDAADAINAAVMPFIDQANISCGAHAGDLVSIEKTLLAAKSHQLMVGAHPGYPDREGFGRRSTYLSPSESYAQIFHQISALDEMASGIGIELIYVKPHGALYNDMLVDTALRQSVMRAIASFAKPMTLIMQATPNFRHHREEAFKEGLDVWFEAFSDRGYTDNGHLLARSEPGAVYAKEGILSQVDRICRQQEVITNSGRILPLNADTLCVHGDNPQSVHTIQAIRELVDQ